MKLRDQIEGIVFCDYADKNEDLICKPQPAFYHRVGVFVLCALYIGLMVWRVRQWIMQGSMILADASLLMTTSAMLKRQGVLVGFAPFTFERMRLRPSRHM